MQETEAVLEYFGATKKQARNAYRTFVREGINQWRDDDLTSCGMICSLGGWTAVQHNRKADAHTRRDERIMGDSAFVTQALFRGTEALERRYALQASGVDVDVIAGRIAQLLNMDVQEIWQPGKYKRLVTARSLLCLWAVRELGESMVSLARRLGISTVAVSKSVERGKRLVKEMGLSFIES